MAPRPLAWSSHGHLLAFLLGPHAPLGLPGTHSGEMVSLPRFLWAGDSRRVDVVESRRSGEPAMPEDPAPYS